MSGKPKSVKKSLDDMTIGELKVYARKNSIRGYSTKKTKKMLLAFLKSGHKVMSSRKRSAKKKASAKRSAKKKASAKRSAKKKASAKRSAKKKAPRVKKGTRKRPSKKSRKLDLTGDQASIIKVLNTMTRKDIMNHSDTKVLYANLEASVRRNKKDVYVKVLAEEIVKKRKKTFCKI